MPPSNLTISPLSPTEVPSYQSLRDQAFVDTVNKILYSRAPSQQTLDRAIKDHQESIAEGVDYLKCVDTDTGELIAGARWRYVGPKEGNTERTLEDLQKDLLIHEPYVDSDPAVWNAFFEMLNQGKQKHMGARSYYALDTLVTHPNHHRRGAGGMLVQWGCEQADAKGVECYLEASPMGVPLYERFGFQRIQEVSIDLGKFGGDEKLTFILMRRPAKVQRAEA